MLKNRRLISLALAVVLVFAFMAMTASAAQVENHEGCTCSAIEDEDAIQPRALACMACPTGFYRKLASGGYRCDVCGDEI